MEYPEHEKMKAVLDECDIVTDFMDWAQEQGIYLTQWGPDTYGESLQSVEYGNELLARWKGIDLKKVEEEKRQMLESIRKLNEDR